MRLNKFLSNSGVASRRKCDELIKEGKVFVNGQQVNEFGIQINPKKDKVSVEGKIVTLPSSFVYIKLNKPKGYACTASDEKGRKTIYELVDCDERLFSIGRLDYNSEGLLLLTNDGDFANKIAHPKYHMDKEYKVTVEGELKESELAVLRKGVVIDGERMPSARVELLSIENGFTKLSIIIDEGQNRQIRRMIEAIGHEIKLLKRVRIGQVKLGGLSRGEYKDLTEDELNSLVKNK
jgi:23S rRNA pseudouridine2605 synthase